MEVLDRLRADDQLAAVPVIMLTHSTDRELLVEALRRGAHDYLRKPVDPAELDARVMAALRVKRLHDALLEANQRLALQALTDDLTGLANRRHGAHQLEREIALCVRHGRLLALVRVDVDHFKAINDTHGHQTGDQVLVAVAARLAQAVRGGDELARWGGDEFVAILPDTDKPGALRAAERLRAAVGTVPVEAAGGILPITISVGWAHWSGDTPDDLLARADRALYKAKDAGRDTVWPPS
jgi:two-component system cell cycle response regulator